MLIKLEIGRRSIPRHGIRVPARQIQKRNDFVPENEAYRLSRKCHTHCSYCRRSVRPHLRRYKRALVVLAHHTSSHLGLAGLLAFMAFETLRIVVEPVVPPRLSTNRTSATVFAVTFFNSALLYWVMFFLPIYSQAVLGSSPTAAGVRLLPIIVVAAPAAILAVMLLKFGKYKPLHLFGFAVCTIGLGMFTLLDTKSTTAEWVIFQIITRGGSSFVLNTLLPALPSRPHGERPGSNNRNLVLHPQFWQHLGRRYPSRDIQQSL